MLSNKLTFSLVFVLALALVAGPAFAQVVSGNLNITEDGTTAGMIPKNGFVVFEKTGATTATNGIIDAATDDPVITQLAAAAANFPDIADLLRYGGTIELLLNVGASGSTTHTAVSDKTEVMNVGGTLTLVSSLTPEKALTFKHRLVISEIMWAYDGTTAGTPPTGDQASQWIEIYNNHNTAGLKSGDMVYLVFHPGRRHSRVGTTVVGASAAGSGVDVVITTLTANTDFVVVDAVNTTDSFGRSWNLPGQHGNTDPDLNDDGTYRAPVSLISMYRKNDLKNVGTDTVFADTSFGNGNEGGQWAASAARVNMDGAYMGTPGRAPIAGTATAQNPASIPTNGIIINEVRNDTSSENLDWIEIYYNGNLTTDNPINIDGYELQIVEADLNADGAFKNVNTQPKKERTLVNFPKYKLSAGEYFVVYNRHPGDTILAGGVNVVDVENGEQINKGASHAYFVSSDLNLPNTGKFLLVLRSANDQDNEPDAIKDFAGNGFFTLIEATKAGGFDGDHRYDTRAFPMNGWGVPGDQEAFGDNTFASATQSFGRETGLTGDGTYRPESGGNRVHKDNWLTYGYMGGSGYDRNIDTRSAVGTPGYANVSPNNVSDDRDNSDAADDYAFSGKVTISEIMYDAGPRWNLIQWIELYNSSMTETINIAGWTLEIRNLDTEVESFVDTSFSFEANTRILPNQTLLLVSGTGANDVEGDRVYNLYQHHRSRLGLLARDSRLLSRDGFYLKLSAKAAAGGNTIMVVQDEAGNLMVDGTIRTKMWDLPDRGDVRQSLIRQYGDRAIDGGGPYDADDGTMASSWIQSDLTGAGLSFYGHRDDIGTPGYRLGGPLPVSLSSFRPVRNDATGHVDITWVTESELNNAGFNILRSESKTGEFQVINVKGIVAGHGTTSEKHVYTYTDTTAKPNVVYYYQIEDVSLDGNRTTLRTTHLRGNVSAGGKLTTTWGDLKTQ